MPGDEPVTLEEAKARLGVRSDHRDAELTGNIIAARQHVENVTGFILTRRQVQREFRMAGGCAPLAVHAWPLVSLDSVQAYDAAGELQDVDGARLIGSVRPGRIFPAVGATWPVGGNPGLLVATFTAGWLPEDVPETLKLAMHLLIGLWFENHEAVVVGTIATELPLGVLNLCRAASEDPGIS